MCPLESQSQLGPSVRFGPFELDVRLGELQHNGRKVILNQQPLQLLLALLEQPGELVSREDLVKRLWPDGTFVDYEHGVNSAVNRIREALGDTASNPRFVETLARRGYRFVAPVERVGNPVVEVAEVASPPEAPTVGLLDRVLASEEELPKVSYPVVQALFLGLQLMYVGFYVGALANLAEIEDLLSALPSAERAVARRSSAPSSP